MSKSKFVIISKDLDFCIVDKIAVQTYVTAIGYVKCLLDRLVSQEGSFNFDNINNRIFVPDTGAYFIGFNARWVIAAGLGHRGGAIFVNGVQNISQNYGVTQATTPREVLGGSVIRLTAGDYVELFLQQSSGANLNVQAIAGISPLLSIAKVFS